MIRRASIAALAATLIVTACAGDAGEPTTAPTTTTRETTTTQVPSTTTTTTQAPSTTTTATLPPEATTTTLPPLEYPEPLPASTVWVGYDDGLVQRVDAATGEVTGEVQAVPADLTAIGLGSLWLVSCATETITEVSLVGLSVMDPLPIGGCPTAMAVADGMILMAREDLNAIVGLDPATGEISTVLEAEAPTALDAVNPMLVGGRNGLISYEGEDGKGWTTRLRGSWVAATSIRGGIWDTTLFVLAFAADGHPFIVQLDTATGDIIEESWDLDFLDVLYFLALADWVYALGDYANGGSALWWAPANGGNQSESSLPSMATGMTGAQGSDGTPIVAVVGGDGSTSALYTIPVGSPGPPQEYDLGHAGATSVASVGVPRPCDDPRAAELRAAITRAADQLATMRDYAWTLNRLFGLVIDGAEALRTQYPDSGVARVVVESVVESYLAFSRESQKIVEAALAAAELADRSSAVCEPDELAAMGTEASRLAADAEAAIQNAVGRYSAAQDLVAKGREELRGG